MNEPSPNADTNDSNETDDKSVASTTSSKSSKRAPLRMGILIFGNVVLPLLMAFGIVWLYNYLVDTPPTAERVQREKKARLVEALTIELGSHHAEIDAFGTVKADRMVDLKPQVASSILTISPDRFQLGGVFRTGEAMLRLDPRDFELMREIRAQEVNQANQQIQVLNGDLSDAKARLSVELGRQEIARKEYEVMGREITDKEQLARLLREPQLAQAKGAIAAVEAKIEAASAAHLIALQRKLEAELAVERCVVYAPFNAMVMERMAEVGDRASLSAPLARLASTDTARIEVAIPSDALSWIKLPTHPAAPRADDGKGGATAIIGEGYDGSTVTIRQPHAWGPEVSRPARIVRFSPATSDGSRQPILLLEIDDPFSLESRNLDLPPVLIGSFVSVSINGIEIANAAKIPREYLREGSTLWIAKADNTLEIRKVTPTWTTRDSIYLNAGIEAGERVIASPLATPVDGLALRVREVGTAKPEEVEAGGTKK